MFEGKSILVTGGTGSFGKAFVGHMLANYNLNRLIIFSRDELKQFEMQQIFPNDKYPNLRYFIGDIRDESRLRMAMRGVDYVIHAAALKQVPAAEYNPFECIKTNVIGAENVISAAIYNNVKKVVALSTDKAANPINLYGATKLASDKAFISSNNLSGATGPRFCVIRYGNVMGSRGSVLPFFQKCLQEGRKSLPITDERMTRFWITLEQGVNFVIQSLENMKGGEIFVPKIPSMKVVDIARALAPNIDLEFVGIRPGEKLHEIMVPEDEARNTLEFENYYVIQPAFHWWDTTSYQEKMGGSPVDDDFSYRSDKNTQWMSTEELRKLVSEL
ncbi:MAG: UDP-N-acetylglucosamine 4,6-dehydratase (inverting) [Bdellovibrionales bacterium]|nr:UDP-N-acetylglucosamine 4,6-dehydratase (inverting) [Bdellovibrionales bacterium]